MYHFTEKFGPHTCGGCRYYQPDNFCQGTCKIHWPEKAFSLDSSKVLLHPTEECPKNAKIEKYWKPPFGYRVSLGWLNKNPSVKKDLQNEIASIMKDALEPANV